VPEFLSPDWVASLDRAARASDRLAQCARGDALILEQRVTLPDGSTHSHHLVLDESGARVREGKPARADVVVLTDLATATELAVGTTNAQQALGAGRLRVHGDVNALIARAEQLAALDDVFARARDDTTFPSRSEVTVHSPGHP
jgi:putative sterol carrier protein